LEWTIFGTQTETVAPTLTWWLLRPVAIIGPLLATLPVIYLFGRRWQTQTVTPPPRILPIVDEDVGDGGDGPLEPTRRNRPMIGPLPVVRPVRLRRRNAEQAAPPPS
jgi:hypothetical protein